MAMSLFPIALIRVLLSRVVYRKPLFIKLSIECKQGKTYARRETTAAFPVLHSPRGGLDHRRKYRIGSNNSRVSLYLRTLD